MFLPPGIHSYISIQEAEGIFRLVIVYDGPFFITRLAEWPEYGKININLIGFDVERIVELWLSNGHRISLLA